MYLSIVIGYIKHFIVVQSLSHVQLFVIPWTTARQTHLSSAIFQFAQIYVH